MADNGNDATVPTAERRIDMQLKKAIRLLEREYEIAKHLEMVKKPMAYALYKVWKIADSEPPKQPKANHEEENK
jgi:hypothetical protein